MDEVARRNRSFSDIGIDLATSTAATPDHAGKAPTSMALSVAGACSAAAVLQAGPVVLSHEGDRIVLGAAQDLLNRSPTETEDEAPEHPRSCQGDYP